MNDREDGSSVRSFSDGRISRLPCGDVEDLIRQQPVTVVLYYSPADHGVAELLEEFSAVAECFGEPVVFSVVDVSQPENQELRERNIVVLTPTIIYYRFGKPWDEDVGEVEIRKWLDHDSIVWRCCHTDTWLKLVR